jgi:hypothetical protein
MAIEPWWALALVAALNALVAVYWTQWKPNHHAALASMMGIEWRGRPPLLPWRRILKRLRILRTAAGAGIFALREIGIAVLLALAATLASFAAAALALSFASAEGEVRVELGGEVVHGFRATGEALFSHVASSVLRDAFVHTGLPLAEFDGGGLWLTALFLSLLTVLTGVAIKALSELLRCLRYALVCVLFPRSSQQALEGDGSTWIRPLLGLAKLA